ncbi:MAG: phosphotransferase [Rhizomicrobium sp.]
MSDAAPVSNEQASRLAEKLFGAAGSAQPLKSERDQNFVIRGDEGKFVLKITNPAEDRGVTDFHTKALLHIAQVDPSLSVPRLLPTREGGYEAEFVDGDGRTRVVRLLSFLPGVMAASLEPSRDLRTGIARVLARFDRAMADFTHPAADHEIAWDITHAANLRKLLPEIADAANRARAERALDRFDAVAPLLGNLRRQVIHNDLNPFNVLFSEDTPLRVLGVLDFGDMVRAPLINDLAIAASYHVGPAADPLQPLCEMIGAYNEVVPIEAAECDLIADLIATRLAMTVLITEWRAGLFPQNRSYILKNHPAATRGLDLLAGIPRDKAQRRFRGACGLER